MAGLYLNVTSGEFALTANTAQSLQVKAPANQRLVIRGIRIFGKSAAGGTDVPVKVRMTQSSANFGSGSAAVVGKNNQIDPETAQGTYTLLTTEPTSPTDGGIEWEVQPQSGIIEFLAPKLEIPVPGGKAVNFQFTSVATPTMTITLAVEE